MYDPLTEGGLNPANLQKISSFSRSFVLGSQFVRLPEDPVLPTIPNIGSFVLGSQFVRLPGDPVLPTTPNGFDF